MYTTTKPASTPVSPVFSDVHGVGHWAMDSVDYVTTSGLFNGIGGGLFDPDGGVTWHTKGMNWAVENSITFHTSPAGNNIRRSGRDGPNND